MIEKPDYFRATNLAYEVLSYYDLTLPINLFKVMEQFENLIVISYSEVANRFNMKYSDFLKIASSEHGYLQRSKRDPCKAYIIYNDWKDERSIRFTLAHELGHYVLMHKEENKISDKEASCFARNLLCPIPVGEILEIESVSDYMNTFGISDLMANVCKKFRKSDQYYISAYYKSKIENLFQQSYLTYSLI